MPTASSYKVRKPRMTKLGPGGGVGAHYLISLSLSIYISVRLGKYICALLKLSKKNEFFLQVCRSSVKDS